MTDILKKILKRIEALLKKVVEFIYINSLIKNYKDIEKVIYFSTPEHNNLGDQAIAIAIEKILKDKYKDKLILEFSYNKYNRNKKMIRKLLNENDIIVTIGGGNFGNLYLYEEEQRRDIVERFPNNKIIVMPQSISFTNDEIGKKEIEKSNSIYSKHKNFNIITRDRKSYKYGKEYFPNNNVYLTPDSVLYLEDWYRNDADRKDVILTLRSDKEKALDNEKIDRIIKHLESKKINFRRDDTIQKYSVNKETREYEVKNMLRKISSAKLNITDRFHGVIFSVITNTPVIVFKSLDHKIEEGVKWFKHLDWVHYVTTVEEAEKLIDKYMNSEYKVEKEKYELKEKLKEVFFNI